VQPGAMEKGIGQDGVTVACEGLLHLLEGEAYARQEGDAPH
jgi:hypothetical protein